MARMSYMGYCLIGGVLVKCTNMSITKKVEPVFFDHVVGLKDSGYAGGQAKGPGVSGGKEHRQKGIYRWSRFTGTASISGPLTESIFGYLMDLAISGNSISTSSFNFYSGNGKSVSGAFITSMGVDIKAGDVATFSAELIAKDVVDSGGVSNQGDCDKLITWDKCEVSSDVEGDLVGFSLNISNPAIPINVSGSSVQNDLGPVDIRIGMQEVKGSISSFSPNSWNDVPGNIHLNVAGSSYTINVVYGGPTNTSASGPFISTVPWTGASDGPVWT